MTQLLGFQGDTSQIQDLVHRDFLNTYTQFHDGFRLHWNPQAPRQQSRRKGPPFSPARPEGGLVYAMLGGLMLFRPVKNFLVFFKNIFKI